jgi:CRP-like cAMP-binding protein
MFEGITDAELAGLEAIAHLEEIKRGERLFSRGEAAEKFYIVRDGAFSLALPLRRRERIVDLDVEEKGTGEALGWSSLVAPYRSVYSCYCTADGSLFSFRQAEMLELMSSTSKLGIRIGINLNRLIAGCFQSLQIQWIEEVEKSEESADHWSRAEVASHFALAVRTPRKKRPSGPRLFNPLLRLMRSPPGFGSSL